MDTMKFAVFFIAGVTVLGFCACECPHGWTGNQTSCYLYFHEEYTFFEAKVACEVVQGHLVEINNAKENTFVVNLARANGGPSLWTGMEDFVTEGEYEFSFSHVRPTYFNWVDGDPNNWRNQEDCVAMDVGKEGWYNFDCEYKYPFVCEMETEEMIG